MVKTMTEFENQLVLDNLRLVDKVIRTRITFRASSALMDYEDLQGVGREALCRAAIRYRPSLGAFEPFAATCIYNAIVDHCKSENIVAGAISDSMDQETQEALLEKLSAERPDYDAVIDSVTVEQMLREFKEKYNGVARLGVEAIEMKMLGFSAKEIARRYGTSINNVNAWISRARSKLRNESSLTRLLL